MASSDKDYFNIRPIKEDESEQLFQMVMELAEFEKMPERVKSSPESLRRAIFDQPQRCHCLVAEITKNKEIGIVGMSLYYYAYSTWDGLFVHLEDLYVKPDYRGKGIGKGLYQATTQIAIDTGCTRVELDVLGWNKPAKEFYERVGNEDTTESDGWHKMRLKREQMEKFVQM